VLFNSYIFIFIFLPITFFIFFFLNSKRMVVAGKSFLVLSSLFFYSYWDKAYLPIILSSMLINYAIGSSFLKKNDINKHLVLIIGISFNLFLLGYFKYMDFFIENFNIIFNQEIKLLYLTLPLAISFFTFQQIAYLIDSYRGETKEYDFLNYSLFVTFFPQLIAGPIVHHKQMMPQFTSLRNLFINYRNILMGLFIFSIGLFKKVAIADTFSSWVATGFYNGSSLSFIDSWATSLSYTFQIYFDFSGYSDMAIGIGLLFNIKLPINFNSPYKALDIQDFWRRWHITLSIFLRDYVYIPLGGNKGSSFSVYNNLMITFLIGGMWHGAGWTFIFWGFLHGFAIILHRVWLQLNFKMNRILAWLITFNFINISWIFFRADNFNEAIAILYGMLGFNGVNLPVSFSQFEYLKYFQEYVSFGGLNHEQNIWVVLSLIVVLFFRNSLYLTLKCKFFIKVFIFTFTLNLGLLNMNRVSEFLYFNF